MWCGVMRWWYTQLPPHWSTRWPQNNLPSGDKHTYYTDNLLSMTCHSSAAGTCITVFRWINVPAWINGAPTFDFDWIYLRKSSTDLIHIFSTWSYGIQESTRWLSLKADTVKCSFSAPSPARSFGEIRYLQTDHWSSVLYIVQVSHIFKGAQSYVPYIFAYRSHSHISHPYNLGPDIENWC